MNSPSDIREGAQLDFSNDMSYGDYLGLDRLLAAQKPQSEAHDELLFIIQHQTSELWMRLALHELNHARQRIIAGDLPPAFKMITRVARIFDQLNSAWDVLRTMTPSEYTTFREALKAGSGFQSHQYRLIEFLLGNRVQKLMKLFEHEPEKHVMLVEELSRPSLYQCAIELAASRMGVDVQVGPAALTPWEAQLGVRDLWQRVYEDPATYWDVYELAEKLVDLEDYFRRWRFNHVTTVERVIGFKRGTGGTVGVPYLRKMLEVELFPELWQVRGVL